MQTENLENTNILDDLLPNLSSKWIWVFQAE